MKRLVFLLVLVVLLSALLSACVLYVDQNEASKFCKANDDFGTTHGKCVSALTSASSIAEFCQENWDEPLFWYGELYTFENQGDCVSTINAQDWRYNP
jgi:hypothetical protein